MSEVEKNEQIHSNNIERNKAVLRASDIIPSLNKKELLSHSSAIPIKEIPKFDLAEEIMAEQRKVTSIRRKGPVRETEVKKSEQSSKPAAGMVRMKAILPELSGHDQVIKEIVARDIERFYRSDRPVA